jgi:hypothetical protein
MVGIVKDKTDQDSWFSAKPITVGNLSKYLSRYRTSSQTRQKCSILYKLGNREDFTSEYADSEWQRLSLNDQT